MSLGKLGEGRVVSFLIADDRRVGFDDDLVLIAVIDDSALLAERVELTKCQSKGIFDKYMLS